MAKANPSNVHIIFEKLFTQPILQSMWVPKEYVQFSDSSAIYDDLHGKQNSNSQKVCIMLNITYKIIFYIHFLTLFMLVQWCTVECQQNFKVKFKKYLKDIQHVYCIRRKSFPSLSNFINLIKLLKR